MMAAKCKKTHRCPYCGSVVPCRVDLVLAATVPSVARLAARLMRLKVEENWFLWFDDEVTLIGQSMVAMGNEREASASAQEIARCGARAGSSFAVELHNHPGREFADASDGDILHFHQVRTVLDAVGIDLLDSVIVSRAGNVRSISAGERSRKARR